MADQVAAVGTDIGSSIEPASLAQCGSRSEKIVLSCVGDTSMTPPYRFLLRCYDSILLLHCES